MIYSELCAYLIPTAHQSVVNLKYTYLVLGPVLITYASSVLCKVSLRQTRVKYSSNNLYFTYLSSSKRPAYIPWAYLGGCLKKFFS